MPFLSEAIYALMQLGAAIVLGLTALASIFSPTVAVVQPPVQLHDTASTTISTTTTAQKPSEKSLAKVSPPVPSKKSPDLLPVHQPGTAGQIFSQKPAAPLAVTTPPSQARPADINGQTRAALVNILCITQAGGYLNPISGSGVIIDSRGIILTNAHVAQFFLLKDYLVKNNVQCVVRMGSPAQPRYTAELVYLPPAWVNDNASKILSTEPTGTGENDYAFLYITGTTDPGGTLPASFSHVPLHVGNVDTDTPVLLASYPAGFINGLTIEKSLYQTSAYTSVGNLYSFDSTQNVDVFSIGGTIISQAGSSGGAVVDAGTGALNGIIVTATASATTAGRQLNAITLGHIDRSLLEAGKGGILGLLSQNPTDATSNFAAYAAPALTSLLSTQLKKALP